MQTLEALFRTIKDYRVLVVGDEIVDEYVYVKPRGKSPKENIITNLYLERETFQGGVVAAARHVRAFCGTVDVWHGCQKKIIKRRFVEKLYMQKLFEIHEEHEREIRSIEPYYDDYDMVIVTDFGHGCVTPSMIENMTRKARFLAVNTQTNSANHGFNLITKYPRADYVVLDELEARLAARDRESPIEAVVDSLDYPRIVVTLGPRGSIGQYHGEIVSADAVSRNVVDTMGAGDAFFCVTAPLAAAGADIETLCRVGNAAGAVKCSVVGHRQPVTPATLRAALDAALPSEAEHAHQQFP